MTKTIVAFSSLASLAFAFACSAGPSSGASDADGDKVVDSLGKSTGDYDLDGDGTVDGTGIDTDDDGKPDGLGIDTDDDGIFDAIDFDGDGKPDKSAPTGTGGAGSGTGGGSGIVIPPSTGGVTNKDCNPTEIVLPVVYRDFTEAHSDFEMGFSGDGVRRTLVNAALGSDKKPVFASTTGCAGLDAVPLGCRTDWTPTNAEFENEASFDQWYRDTDLINIRLEKELILTPDAAKPGTFSFASNSFFPLGPEEGFGKSPAGNSNNFLFTTEIHLEFGYQKGQKFTFKGDDDVWVFINNKLALDLGGMHSEAEATIDFDAQASDLGIVAGNSYAMDVFHAERHTSGSNFRIETNIACFKPIVVK